MPRHQVLRWIDGYGWLILSGGADAASEIRGLALARTIAGGGAAYLWLGAEAGPGDRALADMEDLGAPAGYLVDVLTEDDETLYTKLAEAGIIVIEGGPSADEWRSGLLGAAERGMRAAFENGAVILAEGASAMVLGAWVVLQSGELADGLKWLDNTLVVPGITSLAQSEQAQAVLKAQPTGLAIGIGLGSALALGPAGEVETWGERQVTIALGSNYRR